MSMIYGVISHRKEQLPPGWQEAMDDRAAKWPADHAAHEAGESAYIAIRERTAHAGAPSGGFARTASDMLVFDGRLDNRRELLAHFNLGQATDAELALAALGEWGEKFAGQLIGDFAIAAFDMNAGNLVLARDAMGIRPLFVAETQDWLAFASNMDVMLALPCVDTAPDHEWLVHYMESLRTDADGTPYRGMRIVRPGRTIRYSESTKREIRHWAPPPVGAMLDISREEAIKEYGRLLTQAVSCRLPAHGPVAAELSGGLDSSSIAVTAAPLLEARGDRLLTISHVMEDTPFPIEGLRDEREEITSVLSVLQGHEHRWLNFAPESQLALLAETVARHGGPQRRDFSSAQPMLATIMRDADCRILLSGHGGDECATSVARGLEESLAEAGQFDTLMSIVPRKSRWLWRTAAGRQLLRLRALHRQRRALRAAPRMSRGAFVSDAELIRTRCAYPVRPVWGTIAERERSVIESAHIAQRTQDCAVGSGPDGFRHAYPMLDQRLVEFHLRVPDLVKRTPDVNRLLIREAMKSVLPDRVRLRTDKNGLVTPIAISGFLRELDRYYALIAQHKEDPLVAKLIDVPAVLRSIERFQADPGTRQDTGTQQIRRAAQICLWRATLT